MSRMGLNRTGSKSYRSYLASGAWRARKHRWFHDRRDEGYEPACVICGLSLTELGALDLHHMNYAGVTEHPDGTWSAREADEDLMPMCRHHHQLLHRAMDRHREYHGWDRGKATVVIAASMVRRFSALSPAASEAVLEQIRDEYAQYHHREATRQ